MNSYGEQLVVGNTDAEEQIFFNWAKLPEVVFVEIMRRLNGENVEKCRLISRNFYSRIEMNRERLPRVCVTVIHMEQSRSWEMVDDDPNEDNVKVRWCTERKPYESDSLFQVPPCDFPNYSLTTIKKNLSHFAKRITLRNLIARHVCAFVLKAVLEELANARITCEAVGLSIADSELEQDDIHALISWVAPKVLVLKTIWLMSPLQTSFYQSECITNLSELYVYAASGSQEIVDDVLLKSHFKVLSITDGCGITLEALAKFLLEWNVGSRDFVSVKVSIEGNGMDRNRFLSLLPWPVHDAIADAEGYYEHRVERKVTNQKGDPLMIAITLSFPQQLKIHLYRLRLEGDIWKAIRFRDETFDEYSDSRDNSEILSDLDGTNFDDLDRGPEEFDYDDYDEDLDDDDLRF